MARAGGEREQTSASVSAKRKSRGIRRVEEGRKEGTRGRQSARGVGELSGLALSSRASVRDAVGGYRGGNMAATDE